MKQIKVLEQRQGKILIKILQEQITKIQIIAFELCLLKFSKDKNANMLINRDYLSVYINYIGEINNLKIVNSYFDNNFSYEDLSCSKFSLNFWKFVA